MPKKVQFGWDGVDQLRKDLEAVGYALDDTDPALKTVILDGSAKKFVDEARSLVPVKTGTLRDAIFATKGGKKQRGILLGVNKKKAWYGRLVEFGTVKMSAKPYFRPALLKMASTYAADLQPGIKELVEKTSTANAYHPPR